jgi:hypothetical protein
VDTSFIARHEGQLLGPQPVPHGVLALAAVVFEAAAAQGAAAAAADSLPGPWSQPSGLRCDVEGLDGRGEGDMVHCCLSGCAAAVIPVRQAMLVAAAATTTFCRHMLARGVPYSPP